MENSLKTPLNQPQLELLKMFSREVDSQHWLEIKQLIVAYFAEKAIAGANKTWDEQEWDDQKVDDILNSHLRTPYRKQTK